MKNEKSGHENDDNQNNSENENPDSEQGTFERGDHSRDIENERDFLGSDENSCHLRAEGDFLDSELNERASSKDRNLDFLTKDTVGKLNSSEKTKPDFTFDIDKENKNYKEKLGVSERAAAYACEQMEKMQEGMPDSYMKDFANGSCKMVEKFVEMKNWNHKEAGWDKYFHCMGNCEAAEFGEGGNDAARFWGDLREQIFNDSDSANDLNANERGRLGAEQGLRCYDVCVEYKPFKYR